MTPCCGVLSSQGFSVHAHLVQHVDDALDLGLGQPDAPRLKRARELFIIHNPLLEAVQHVDVLEGSERHLFVALHVCKDFLQDPVRHR